jgi:predicted nucleotidyltransferase
MQKALEARRCQREEYIATARSYAVDLQNELGPLTAVLIGSVARGDFNLGSDLDVLIISDNLPAEPLKRSHLLYSMIKPLVEPKGYTRSEFKTLLTKKNPSAVAVTNEGVILLDDGFLQTIL